MRGISESSFGHSFAGLALLLALGCGRATSNPKPGGGPGEDGSSASAGKGSGGGDAQGAGAALGGGAAAPSTPGAGGITGGTEPGCTEHVPSSSQFLRLTQKEYDRTIRDLLGVLSITSGPFSPPSTLLTASDNSNTVRSEDVNGYQAAAQAVAALARSDASIRNRFITCDPVAQASCWHDTIVAFGRRAFRRPLTNAEVARFERVVAAGPEITETGSPEEIAEVLLTTFLVSPSFLQRKSHDRKNFRS